MRNNFQTHSTPSNKPVLVIGANGKTGRRLVQRLREANLPYREASRSTEIPFDWHDRSTWNRAIEGTGSVYITVYPDLSFPGVSENVGVFANLAVTLGAKRLVLLSGRGEAGAQDAEARLYKSGADLTIVRCSVFNQNFSESFADAIRYGRLSMPIGDIQEPFVDAEDIADVAFAALLETEADEAPFQMAEIYCLRGDHEQAFYWLDRAAELNDNGLVQILGSSWLRPLRDDPRWAGVMTGLNIPWEG